MKETEKTLSSLDKVQKRRSGGVGRDFLLGLCELFCFQWSAHRMSSRSDDSFLIILVQL